MYGSLGVFKCDSNEHVSIEIYKTHSGKISFEIFVYGESVARAEPSVKDTRKIRKIVKKHFKEEN
ncbi:hypothetical protein [Bacillus cereus]